MRLYFLALLVLSCQLLISYSYQATLPSRQLKSKVRSLPKESIRSTILLASDVGQGDAAASAALMATTAATATVRRLALLTKIQSFLDPSAFGGLLAGGLHAITG